jgi:hypothetical protein
MTRSLLRVCLARGCRNVIRGRTYCHEHQRIKEQAKRGRRPDLHNDAHERERRRRVVADHRAIVGDWCPGWERKPAHASADLTADHIKEVGRGGSPYGDLVVRCRGCNAARSSAIVARVLRTMQTNDPLPAERPITHRDSDDPGPVAA